MEPKYVIKHLSKLQGPYKLFKMDEWKIKYLGQVAQLEGAPCCSHEVVGSRHVTFQKMK